MKLFQKTFKIMDTYYKGTKMNDIYKGLGPWNYENPPIHPSKYHSILFELPVNRGVPPKPHVSLQTFHWDEGYVRMPYSQKNLYPSKDTQGKDVLSSRWEVMQQSLLQPIPSSRALEDAIRKYNSKLPRFSALHYLFEEVFSEDESDHFFKFLLPKIINLALQLPDILPGNVPLLKADSCKSISLSQMQIASLMACCFLCMMPFRKDIALTYPGVYFECLFAANRQSDTTMEKLKCILHYFRRVLEYSPVGVVTFERRHMRKTNMPRWDKIKNNLGNTRVHISSTGTIEDDGLGCLQVDFANKMVGGGVMGYGCVQEEIRFVICPELIVSRLFTEKLGSTEALIITGVERYSKYKGYGDTFEWGGDFKDETPFDESGRRQTNIVAIDAIYFPRTQDQFHSSQILRELNKAYVGFYSRQSGAIPPVATGNWGCGAFRGNVHLKFLIQLMACSAANRDMIYYTFSDKTLMEEIYNIYGFIASNQITSCQLWRIFCRFAGADLVPENFFPFIQQAFFDLKSQPSPPKLLFNLSKKLPESPVASVPGSSKTESKSENDAEKEMDTVDLCVTSPVSSKRKRVSQGCDLLSIIDKIDGNEEGEVKSDSTTTGNSFLDLVDDFAKRQSEHKINSRDVETNEQIVTNDKPEEMEVDDILVSLENAPEASITTKKSNEKRKITDYFRKV